MNKNFGCNSSDMLMLLNDKFVNENQNKKSNKNEKINSKKE